LQAIWKGIQGYGTAQAETGSQSYPLALLALQDISSMLVFMLGAHGGII